MHHEAARALRMMESDAIGGCGTTATHFMRRQRTTWAHGLRGVQALYLHPSQSFHPRTAANYDRARVHTTLNEMSYCKECGRQVAAANEQFVDDFRIAS